MTPVLVGCSHGTDSPTGRAVVRGLLDDVRGLLPGVEVVEAFVDVQEPQIDEVLAGLTAAGRTAVVVPLLLSAGFHTRVDIGRAVRAADGRAVATGTLGPHPLLAELLDHRLRAAGADPRHDAVVLAGAGSSDARSAQDVGETARLLADAGGWVVSTGFATAAAPALPDAVARARASGRRVIAASYVLAPGYFARVVERCGADLVTPPLGPDPRLARIVAERYVAATHSLATSQTASAD